MNIKKTNASSANAISNGWTFQYVAALVIYLEYMDRATNFCIEGEEDIVINLKNNKKICAQAKSSLEKDRIIANHFREIIESIKTLSKNNDAQELISISNFYYPLGEIDCFSYFQFLDKKSFSSLSTKNKDRIINEIENKYDINFENFKLWFVRFEGDEPELGLYDYLKQRLGRVLSNCYVPIRDIALCWLSIIVLNGRSKTINIDADLISGTLYGKILNNVQIDKIVPLIDVEINPIYEEEFVSFFKDYFSKKSQSFKVYNSIVNNYNDFLNSKEPSRKEAIKLFVENYCKKSDIPNEIENFFAKYNDVELAFDCYKLFIAYICFRSNLINLIKEVFNYEN